MLGPRYLHAECRLSCYDSLPYIIQTHTSINTIGSIRRFLIFTEPVISYQLKLIKMHAKLANLNECAVPFLSRAAVNLCWYHCTSLSLLSGNEELITHIECCDSNCYGNDTNCAFRTNRCYHHEILSSINLEEDCQDISHCEIKVRCCMAKLQPIVSISLPFSRQ